MGYDYFRVLILMIISSLCIGINTSFSQAAEEISRYFVGDEVRLQAVTVDKRYIYVIGNNSIIKYNKKDFSKAAGWSEEPGGSISHLNSGLVIKGKLYCAHSNFPESPMLSSVEVFSVKTLKHIKSHSFGFAGGSATWIGRNKGDWWVAFANYSGKRMSEGRDNRWTKLVRFSKDWKEMESWSYPINVLESFGLYSNSGGQWNHQNEIYLTGHDLPEIYVVELPKSGSTLKYIRTIRTVSEGQGFVVENLRGKQILYGISKKEKSIIVQEF